MNVKNLIVIIIGLIVITAIVCNTVKSIAWHSFLVKSTAHDCRFFDEWQKNLACQKIIENENE